MMSYKKIKINAACEGAILSPAWICMEKLAKTNQIGAKIPKKSMH